MYVRYSDGTCPMKAVCPEVQFLELIILLLKNDWEVDEGVFIGRGRSIEITKSKRTPEFYDNFLIKLIVYFRYIAAILKKLNVD